jgi:small-conductance mechanosensitive channel
MARRGPRYGSAMARTDGNGSGVGGTAGDAVETIADQMTQFGEFLPVVIVIAVVLAVLLALRALVLRLTMRNFEDPKVWYRVRKTVTWATTAVFLVVSVLVLTGVGGGLLTYLGILSAGVAVALSDLLRNLAGWLYIATRRPFRIGDRIEIDGQAGDVVDLRAFRFSLLEIRNWVDADQSTGRIVHVPNGKVLSEPLANFGAGFHWVWHEIKVLLTFESDWERATGMLQEILDEESPDVRSREAAEAIRRASKEYLLSFTHLTPTVYLDVKDSGIQLTGRLLCDVRTRRGVTHRVWTALLKVIEADPAVELAYPTVRAFFADPVRLRSDGSDGDESAADPGALRPGPATPPAEA